MRECVLITESIVTSKPFTNKSINKIPRSYSPIEQLINTNKYLSHRQARLPRDSGFHSGTKDEATDLYLDKIIQTTQQTSGAGISISGIETCNYKQ